MRSYCFEIRPQRADDIKTIRQIVEATAFFRPDECEIAEEVLRDSVNTSSGYSSYTAVCDGKIVGWICFGPIACTIGAFDIYWLAVDPQMQSMGIGSKLLDYAHKAIIAIGGRLAVIETSGCDKYTPTRKFYEKNGYALCADIKDFYAPGDNKIVYIRYFLSADR